MVPTTNPGRFVRCGEKGVDLFTRQVFDQFSLVAFAGNAVTGKLNLTDGSTWTYGYDHKNHLVLAEHRSLDENQNLVLDLSAEYVYDAFGNRLAKAVDADGAGPNTALVMKFALDGWNPAKRGPIGNENWDVLADLDANGSLTTRYLRGDIVDELFARIDAPGTPYWYLADSQGSTREVLDGAGEIVDAIVYDAFGNIISESDAAYRGRYAWTGRELDVETNLQYNRARYYDAPTGRWISQDPLGFDAGDSNLYRYVRNRPTVVTDPSGLDEGSTPPSLPSHITQMKNGLLCYETPQGPVSIAPFKLATVLQLEREKGDRLDVFTALKLGPRGTASEKWWTLEENPPLEYLPTSYKVYKVARVAQLPGGEFGAKGFDAYHEWLVIIQPDGSKIAVGMGNGRGVPGQGGQTSPDLPFSPTFTVDHSEEPEQFKKYYKNIDVDCLKTYLEMNRETGRVNLCPTRVQTDGRGE